MQEWHLHWLHFLQYFLESTAGKKNSRRTTADNGGQRPLEIGEGATSLKVQLLLPYVHFIGERYKLK